MYPTYDEIRAKRIAERRRSAIAALCEADEMAKAHGGRLVVFGSLVEGGFDESSDLDIALLGLEPDDDIFLSAKIDTFLCRRGFAPDIREERFIPPELLDRIRRRGRGADDLKRDASNAG